MPAHPDRAAAVRVLEHPEHALDAGADAVSDGLRGDDVDELRARVVRLLLEALVVPCVARLEHFEVDVPAINIDDAENAAVLVAALPLHAHAAASHEA